MSQPKVYNNSQWIASPYSNIVIEPTLVNNSNITTNQNITKAISLKQNNPNLLDNGWFTVNTRNIIHLEGGNGSYQSTTVDRWMLAGATDYGGASHILDVVSNGIKITCNSNALYGFCLFQHFLPEQALIGKTCTLSALILENTTTGSGINLRYDYDGVKSVCNSTTSTGLISGSFVMPNAETFFKIGIQFLNKANDDGKFFVVRAIKLELGEQSTLINDLPPNTHEEQLRCWMSTVDSSDTYANSKFFRFGKDSNGNYGYYKDGSTTLTLF